jgi:hypothetical protein
LNTKPISSTVNIKEVGDDLNRISNLLTNRLATTETVNSIKNKYDFVKPLPKNDSKKDKSKMANSVTSTPSNLPEPSPALPPTTTTTSADMKNQLFNHQYQTVQTQTPKQH